MAIETVVDLLRHGETAGGSRLRGARTDDPLTEAGWRALHAAVGPRPAWDVVAASSLVRCRAFAEAVATSSGADLVVDARLNEYDFGDWDGQPFDRLWSDAGDALAAFFADPDSALPPNGEAASAFRERVRAAWEALVEHGQGRRILVVGHGGVLRQFVADTLGVGGNPHPALEWPNAAMSRVRVFDDPPYPRCRSLVFHGRPAEADGASSAAPRGADA